MRQLNIKSGLIKPSPILNDPKPPTPASKSLFSGILSSKPFRSSSTSKTENEETTTTPQRQTQRSQTMLFSKVFSVEIEKKEEN